MGYTHWKPQSNICQHIHHVAMRMYGNRVVLNVYGKLLPVQWEIEVFAWDRVSEKWCLEFLADGMSIAGKTRGRLRAGSEDKSFVLGLQACACQLGCPHGASKSHETSLILAHLISFSINLWQGIRENVSKNGAVNARIFSTPYNMPGIAAALLVGRTLALSPCGVPAPTAVISMSDFDRMP